MLFVNVDTPPVPFFQEPVCCEAEGPPLENSLHSWSPIEIGTGRVVARVLLSMLKIPPDLGCQNPRNAGSIVCIASCKISIINTMSLNLGATSRRNINLAPRSSLQGA